VYFQFPMPRTEVAPSVTLQFFPSIDVPAILFTSLVF
jgi:hypothetical protein